MSHGKVCRVMQGYVALCRVGRACNIEVHKINKFAKYQNIL